MMLRATGTARANNNQVRNRVDNRTHQEVADSLTAKAPKKAAAKKAPAKATASKATATKAAAAKKTTKK